MAKQDKSLLSQWGDLMKKILGPPIEESTLSPEDRVNRATTLNDPSTESKKPKQITRAFDTIRLQNNAFVKSVLEISVDPDIDNTPKRKK